MTGRVGSGAVVAGVFATLFVADAAVFTFSTGVFVAVSVFEPFSKSLP